MVMRYNRVIECAFKGHFFELVECIMRKLIIVTLICIFVFIVSIHAETLSFLNESDEVAVLKKNLIKAGYLEKEEAESNLFNKKTKDAVLALQHDFSLPETGVASPEIQVIALLLAKLETRTESNAVVTVEQKMPNLLSMSKTNAVSTLQSIGLLPIFTEVFSDKTPADHVVSTVPAAGQSFPGDKRVSVVISKGAKRIDAEHATWYAWWLKGSNEDNYDFGDIYIDDGYLHIELYATINSSIKHRWRGYGTAAIRDTFDKVVPFNLKYETEEIIKGKSQRIELVIPIKDLEVKKPTTLSVKIELYRNKKTEDRLRMDFTFAWP